MFYTQILKTYDILVDITFRWLFINFQGGIYHSFWDQISNEFTTDSYAICQNKLLVKLLILVCGISFIKPEEVKQFHDGDTFVKWLKLTEVVLWGYGSKMWWLSCR